MFLDQQELDLAKENERGSTRAQIDCARSMGEAGGQIATGANHLGGQLLEQIILIMALMGHVAYENRPFRLAHGPTRQYPPSCAHRDPQKEYISVKQEIKTREKKTY